MAAQPAIPDCSNGMGDQPLRPQLLQNHAASRHDPPQLRVVGDQFGSPTYAPHLAAALLKIADQIGKDRDAVEWGILHLANSGYASWYDVAVATINEARRHGMASVPVEAITTADYPTPARRPHNSRLNCDRARDVFGVMLRPGRMVLPPASPPSPIPPTKPNRSG